jgi:hypothetical protein
VYHTDLVLLKVWVANHQFFQVTLQCYIVDHLGIFHSEMDQNRFLKMQIKMF